MTEIPKPKILNVDDYEPGLYAKSRALRLAGFEVYEAMTGTDALRIVEEVKPQIVLLDVQLPDINGIEVCRRIKDNPATAQILVIQTSATFMESRDRVRGLEGGADSYLTEPVEADELIANVRAMLRLRKAEQDAREREAWLATMLRSIGDAVIATDMEGIVTLINPIAQTLVGWTDVGAKGRPIAEVLPVINAETREAGESPIFRVLKEDTNVSHENHNILVTKEGREIPIDDTAALIKDEQGAQIGVVLIFRDITERKRAEEERENSLIREQEARREADAARQRAEQASRLKDEFLATISHELRTPLNHMLGWITMLRGGELHEEQIQNALETIERNVRSQNRLIEDLLDVSRIIAGKLRIEPRPIEIADVVEAAAESARPAAGDKSIHLETTLDPQAGIVSGDAERLQQAVWNLLSNAIKFTPEGGHVRVRLERANSHVKIIVSDNGQGISPDFLPHVFDRFRQEDATTSRQHGGLGLGLTIVRSLVELQGGSVRADSEGEGLGSIFTITLPVAVDHAQPPPETKRGNQTVRKRRSDLPSLEGARILLVDDETDARELFTLMLNKSGAEVITAASGAEAFSLLEKWRPDVILCDIGMPDEDGYSFIRRVRQLDEDRGGVIPAVAITAYASSKDRLQAITSGFQMHIAKPVERAELVAVVANVLGRFLE